jgi:carbon monoxide dehydrogenase subunit G
MKIEKTFTVNAPQERVWSFITDPQKVAPCIPGCEGAEEKERGKYAAAINVKAGPIRTTFHLDIEQTEQRPPQFASYASKGEEGSRASRISAVSTLALQAISDNSTEVTYTSDISIVGRLGKFGSGMMQKIADGIGTEFVAELKSRLERPGASEVAPATAGEVAPPAPGDAPRPRREITVGANWIWWALVIGLGIAALAWWLIQQDSLPGAPS